MKRELGAQSDAMILGFGVVALSLTKRKDRSIEPMHGHTKHNNNNKMMDT